jgi:hypothetical protein
MIFRFVRYDRLDRFPYFFTPETDASKLPTEFFF